MNRRIALIPSYEPSVTLIKIVKELFKQQFVIIVVNDGSHKSYNKIFDELKELSIVLTHEINKGKGEALKTGLSYIAHYFPANSIVVTLDADGQHSIKDTINVCNQVSHHAQAIILGVRSFDQDVPLRSRFGNSVTKFIFRISTRLNVSDTQTGLRAFKADMIPYLLKIEGSRYEYEMNMLLACAKDKVELVEVGIETIYENNNEGSHFDTFKDSARIYKEIFKFMACSFSSFVIDMGLYGILITLVPGLGVALINVIARITSATYNFWLNRHFVFKSKEPLLKSVLQYFLLAGFIMIGNTFFLSFMVYDLGINELIAKLMTEVSFFTLSYLSQRLFIFNHPKKSEVIL